MDVRWSLPAAGDLEHICEWIERDNPEAARRVALRVQVRRFRSGKTGNEPPNSSQPKLTMRAKAHKFEAFVIRLAVNENEIRPDVAVAVIVPFAG